VYKRQPINILIELVAVAFLFNVVVAALNVLPLPPLDGYTFAGALLGRRIPKVFAWIEANRGAIYVILLLLLFLPPTRAIVYWLISLAASHWLLGT